MSIEKNYDIVLSDLEARRQRCSEELAMLDQMIAGLKKFIAPPAQLPLALVRTETPVASAHRNTIPIAKDSQLYAGLSVRWAILYLLAEHSTGPLGTAGIAQALREGGITSNAQNFNGNVSAVLSGMVKDRQEIENVSGEYQISETGRRAWEAIKHTPQWLSRTGSAPPSQ